MTAAAAFQPDWASCPGDTIGDILRRRKIAIDAFASDVGWSLEFAHGLIAGTAQIDEDIAHDLERELGPSANFWLAREQRYRKELVRLNRSDSAELQWLEQLPYADMAKFGWLKPFRSKAEKLAACWEFFDVENLSAWDKRYSTTVALANFRMSSAFETNPMAVAAWLRQGEIKAQQIKCEPWDKSAFRQLLPEIKQLTKQKEPANFWPLLQQQCAKVGVAIVAVRAPSGCRASGATRFLSKSKANIVLSFRYRTDDQFWFTFFHEAAHLILHGHSAVFLEDGSDVTSQEEQEANRFSQDVLIPEDMQDELLTLPLTKWSISRFARQAGVSPGIVLGQLQYRGRVDPKKLNGLKRRYDWSVMDL